MSSASRKDKLQGVVVSLPTPCDDNYVVDHRKLADHVKWLIESGITTGNGVLMAAGGLGEGYFLSAEEHKAVMKTLVDAAGGRVPTMTGCFEVSVRSAIERIKYAADVGIDFIQLNPPHYTRPSDDEVFEHIRMINDAVDIGLMIYNTPWCAMEFEIRPPLMERIVGLQNVVGVKWSSFDFGNFVRVLKLFADKVNFIDNMGGGLGPMLGMKGFISGQANFAPKGELRLWELMKKKDWTAYLQELDRLHGWRDALSAAEEITHVGLGEGTIMKGILAAAGKDFGPPFPAQKRLTPQEIAKIREIIQQAGILEE